MASLLGVEGTRNQIKKVSFVDMSMRRLVVKLDVYEELMGFL